MSFLKRSKVQTRPMEVEQPKTWYFVDLKPGSPVTVDGIYTDMSVMVDVTYHEKGESNNTYLIKAAEIDADHSSGAFVWR